MLAASTVKVQGRLAPSTIAALNLFWSALNILHWKTAGLTVEINASDRRMTYDSAILIETKSGLVAVSVGAPIHSNDAFAACITVVPVGLSDKRCVKALQESVTEAFDKAFTYHGHVLSADTLGHLVLNEENECRRAHSLWHFSDPSVRSYIRELGQAPRNSSDFPMSLAEPIAHMLRQWLQCPPREVH